MVSIEEFAPARRRRGFDADRITDRRDAEPTERLSPLEREILLDIVMVTAGFVLIIAAVILGLSV